MGFHHELGRCKTWMGQAEHGIALEIDANRLNPRSPWRYLRYRHIAWYSLLLGRDHDAIRHLERSLAINPEDDGDLHWQYRRLAAAYARTGNVASARQYLASAQRLWPYDTVRSRAPELLTSPVYVEQFRRFQDALHLAGLRDHADEDADFGVLTDTALHGELAGLTPADAPGAKTLRTVDFVRFLGQCRPIVIDTMTSLLGPIDSWGSWAEICWVRRQLCGRGTRSTEQQTTRVVSGRFSTDRSLRSAGTPSASTVAISLCVSRRSATPRSIGTAADARHGR